LLRPLFPVDEVREAGAGGAPLPDEPRRGHVWPVAVLFCYLEQRPAIAVELAFYPVDDLPEPLADESWAHYRNELGLAPFAGAGSLRDTADGPWHVDFGPHTFVSNPPLSFQIIAPRPDAEWEDAVEANGSCAVVLGTGLASGDETGAVAIPSTAAAVTAAYAGSRAVPELAEIPGLHVVPRNSIRPYDPMRPVTFVLDADVLIAMQRFCFAPARLGDKVEAIRQLLINLSGRDVLPGPALAQLYQPSRTKIDARAALEAFAAFDLLTSLSRAEIMDEHRPPETFDAAYERDVTGLGAAPQILWMYAGVLRLRQLWTPDQTLAERAQSFESFMRWLRDDLSYTQKLWMGVKREAAYSPG
jgi:hypothetical protein